MPNLNNPKRYIAVDLDGVLAEYDHWTGDIGKPVQPMIDNVKQWLKDGHTVVIFTARVCYDPELYSSESNAHADLNFIATQRHLIEVWCKEHIGIILPITAQKNFLMTDFYDDRAWRVEKNTGYIYEGN